MSKFWIISLGIAAAAAFLGFSSAKATFGAAGDFIGAVIVAPAYAATVLVVAFAIWAVRRIFRRKAH